MVKRRLTAARVRAAGGDGERMLLDVLDEKAPAAREGATRARIPSRRVATPEAVSAHRELALQSYCKSKTAEMWPIFDFRIVIYVNCLL